MRNQMYFFLFLKWLFSHFCEKKANWFIHCFQMLLFLLYSAVGEYLTLKMEPNNSASSFKVACRVKTNTNNKAKKTTTSFHYFSKKFKGNTLQGHKRYIKIFELERNNLRVQILAAKMT